ncbi:MAG TPA: hypothetical protein VGG75_38440 [Trebonia sp.]|jgi:hypothetical protein
MSTPEPLDEEQAPKVEVRGGDREADWNTPLSYLPAYEDAGAGCGPDCACHEDE